MSEHDSGWLHDAHQEWLTEHRANPPEHEFAVISLNGGLEHVAHYYPNGWQWIDEQGRRCTTHQPHMVRGLTPSEEQGEELLRLKASRWVQAYREPPAES